MIHTLTVMKAVFTNYILIFLWLILFSACQNGNNEGTLKEIEDKDSNASIIRMPVTGQTGEVDPQNAAVMVFEEANHDFGRVKEGTIVEHTFNFTNTGKVNLIITDARSTCGCTVPRWPEEPIQPGQSGAITVKFNTEGRVENQSKPITVTANTYPSRTKLQLTGFVIPKESN